MEDCYDVNANMDSVAYSEGKKDYSFVPVSLASPNLSYKEAQLGL